MTPQDAYRQRKRQEHGCIDCGEPFQGPGARCNDCREKSNRERQFSRALDIVATYVNCGTKRIEIVLTKLTM